jgi:hypothetical protein
LRPNANRLSEKWFTAIKRGDTPHNNPISKLVQEWCEEFMHKENIAVPKMEIV